MVSISRSSISTHSRDAFFCFSFVEPFLLTSLLIVHLLLEPLLHFSAACRALARHSSESVCSCFLKLAFCSSSCLCILSSASCSSSFFWRSLCSALLWSRLCHAQLFHCFSVSDGSLLPLLNGVPQLQLFLSKLLSQLVDVAPSSGADSVPAEAARVPPPSSV